MTVFEELCMELNVPIKVDDRGLYTGMTQALANICTEAIMSGASGSAIIDQAKAKFYRVFPHMKK